jgi:ribosomal protein L34E
MFAPVPIPFPIFVVSVSALLACPGVWLTFTRSRRRRGDELRCGACEYLLHGIESDRCPECGTPIDYLNIARGRRRGRSLRIVVGLGLLIAAFAICESPLRRWSGSIYWY